MDYADIHRLSKELHTHEQSPQRGGNFVIDPEFLLKLISISKDYMKFWCTCGHSALEHDAIFACMRIDCKCEKYEVIQFNFDVEPIHGRSVFKETVIYEIDSERIFRNKSLGQVKDGDTGSISVQESQDTLDRSEISEVCEDPLCVEFENSAEHQVKLTNDDDGET